MEQNHNDPEFKNLAASNPIVPLPSLTDAERACNVGDLLQVIAPLNLNGSWEDPTPSVVQPTGQIYRAVNLVSRGWDLKLVSGNGPEEIRIMNGNVSNYFRVLSI